MMTRFLKTIPIILHVEAVHSITTLFFLVFLVFLLKKLGDSTILYIFIYIIIFSANSGSSLKLARQRIELLTRTGLAAVGQVNPYCANSKITKTRRIFTH